MSKILKIFSQTCQAIKCITWHLAEGGLTLGLDIFVLFEIWFIDKRIREPRNE